MSLGTSGLRSRGIAFVATIVGLVFLALPALAHSAQTRVFDGEKFSVEPATIGQWIDKGSDPSQPLLVGGLPDTPGDQYGSIQWKFWKKKKAVGVGAGYAPDCASPCGVINPWDGGRVRVTAYGKHRGKFRKLKVHQWTYWMTGQAAKEENYKMTLRFKRGAWTVTKIDDGRY